MNRIKSPTPSGKRKQGISSATGEHLDDKIIKKLREINERRGKRKDLNFPRYLLSLKKLFQLEENPKMNRQEYQFFLAGFFLGEGSINVSAKRNTSSSFGIMLDPEFSLTQHINGVVHLLNALEYFKTGTIRYKSGSNATLVFRIDSRKSLLEKCIPFCEEFCAPHAGESWRKRFYLFKSLIHLFTLGKHKERKGFIEQLLPIWDALRKERGQRNSAFQSLAEAQQYARDQCKSYSNS